MQNAFVAYVLYHQARETAVYAAKDAKSGIGVVLKRIAEPALAHREVARLRYEHRILTLLAEAKVANVVRPITLLDDADGLTLVLSDTGARSLDKHRQSVTGNVPQIIEVALRVTEALMGMHALGIVHQDINPKNIVVNPVTGIVQVIDFNVASQLAQESTGRDLRGMEGTIPYMSPEQTGRINRSSDARSDLYALGATLFELLTSHLPFEHKDVAELLYAIVSKPAPDVRTLAPDVPALLARVVHKLLEKAPEDRYQTALGLHHDLRMCVAQLEGKPIADGAPLGSRDNSDRFLVPQKLYGRERELELLTDAYRQAAGGKREFVMLAGPSGIGKTALVQELQSVALKDRAFIAMGKHDPVRRHVPFSAFAEAIASVVQAILALPEEAVGGWRRRIQACVGGVGRAMLEVAPAVELLIGPQKDIPKLGPQENENRLLAMLERFVAKVAEKHPLVLFLDDLQWADASTLKLLARIATDPSACAGLLVIGAYRSNETPSEHPLHATLSSISATKALLTVDLQPITAADIKPLIIDSTHADAASAADLATAVCSKTGGNPFFVREFMRQLVNQKLIHVSSTTGVWQWDLEAIRNAPVTENVVSLMGAQIKSWSLAEREIMSTAACLGHAFSLEALAAISQSTTAQVAALLAPSLAQGVVLPLAGDYRYASMGGLDAQYKFAHDKIMEAAYALLDPEAAKAKRFAIGKRLLEKLDPKQMSAWVFNVVGHLNAAISLVVTAADKEQLLVLNMTAGREAKQAAAYALACDYFKIAWNALPEYPWSTRHDVAYELALELAEAEFLAGASLPAQARLDDASLHSKTVLEKANIQHRRCLVMMATGQYNEALNAGLTGMRLLGLNLAESGMTSVIGGMLKFKGAMLGKNIEGLAAAPMAHDPRVEALVELLAATAAPAFMVNDKVFAAVALNMGHLTIAYGNTRHSAFAYGLLSVVSAQELRHYNDAKKFGREAMRALELIPGATSSGAASFFNGGWTKYALTDPLQLCKHFEEAHVQAQENGDPTYAAFSMLGFTASAFHASARDFHAIWQRYESYIQSRVGPQQRLCALTYRQMALCIEGKTDAPLSFDDDTCKEEEIRAFIKTSPFGPAATHFFSHKVIAAWLLDNLEVAHANIVASMDARIFTTAFELGAFPFAYWGALTLVQRARNKTAMSFRDKRTLASMRKMLRVMAAMEGSRCGGASWLIEAEICALRGDGKNALRLYDAACASLVKSGYTLMAATALECAGRYCLTQKLVSMAGSYLSRSVDYYQAWGHLGKVQNLVSEFGASLSLGLTASQSHGDSLGRTTTTWKSVTSKGDASGLDINAMLSLMGNAVHGATLEAIKPGLLQEAMMLLSATRVVCFMTAEQAGLRCVGDTELGAALPLEIARVTVRSRTLSEGDAVKFAEREPAMAARKTSAFMCCPIIIRDQVVGALYAENASLKDAFANLQSTLLMVASQFGMAMENNRLIANVDTVVQTKTTQIRASHLEELRETRENAETLMAGGFAHEIRNALTGSRFALTMMAGDAATAEVPLLQELEEACTALGGADAVAPTVEMLRESVATAVEGVNRAMRVTERILLYAQASHLSAQDDETGLTSCVDAILAEFSAQKSLAGVHTQANIDGNVKVPMSQEHVSIVLRNLIGNAFDAVDSKKGSGSDAHVHVQALMEGTSIIIRVEDNGTGMSTLATQRVFEPFFTTKGPKGTGLGLGLSRKLVRLYGGEIRFTTELQKGTTFEIVLPQA